LEHLETLFRNEDSGKYNIPDKMATLHISDFVKQNAANTILIHNFPKL
jgi:hypothetical protein